MNEIVIYVFIALLIVGFIMLKKLCNSNKKNYNTLIEYLSKNIDILTSHDELIYMNMLKETSDLIYNYKESEYRLPFNYMSFFKYNYKNDNISLDFLFTLNNSNSVVDEKLLNDLTITANIFSSSILKSDDNLNYIYIDDIKTIEYNKSVYSIFKERDVYKIFFKTNNNDLENSESDCLGFFFATYSDDYIISDNKQEILSDIIDNVTELI